MFQRKHVDVDHAIVAKRFEKEVKNLMQGKYNKKKEDKI